jgi:hypothetical protein
MAFKQLAGENERRFWRIKASQEEYKDRDFVVAPRLQLFAPKNRQN